MEKVVAQRTLFSVYVAAKILGISVWTLRSWAYKGRVASHKMGTRLMFEKHEIDRIIEESQRPRLTTAGDRRNP